MEYYQEAICNAGRDGISEGCCPSEMKSSITNASYLIRLRRGCEEQAAVYSATKDGVKQALSEDVEML